MKNLYLVTLMTSVYNNFLPEQFNTLKNLHLDEYFDNIKFIIMSDTEPIVPELNINNLTVEYYHVIDAPYPLVTLCKTIYIIDALKDKANDDDIVMLIDSDTKFVDRGKDFFINMYDNLYKYDLTFTHSPWQNMVNDLPDDVREYSTLWMGKDREYKEYMNMNNNYSYSRYDITDKTIYVQTSYFAGKFGAIKRLNDDIRLLMALDLNNRLEEAKPLNCKYQELSRHIPLASEETYCNKIINDNLNNINYQNYNINVEQFNICMYNPFINYYNDYINKYPIFLEQKYDMNKKSCKRNWN